MFKNAYQSGLLSIFFSCGTNPLAIWDMEVRNGHIKRLVDKDVNSVVLELVGTNVTTTFISCPKSNKGLGIRLPVLVMIIKDMKKYFTFEITVIDDKNMRRRFRISNFATATKILPFCTTMPITLSGGWNQIQFNLSDFTKRAYGSSYVETYRVQVHANTRLRRIYFSDRLYSDEELPQDYKLYLPLDRKKGKKEKEKEEPVKPAPSREKAGLTPVKQPSVERVPSKVESKVKSSKEVIEDAAPVVEVLPEAEQKPEASMVEEEVREEEGKAPVEGEDQEKVAELGGEEAAEGAEEETREPGEEAPVGAEEEGPEASPAEGPDEAQEKAADEAVNEAPAEAAAEKAVEEQAE